MNKTSGKKDKFKRLSATVNILIVVISLLVISNLLVGPFKMHILHKKINLFELPILFVSWVFILLTKRCIDGRYSFSRFNSYVDNYRYEILLAVFITVVSVSRFMCIGYGIPHLAEPHEKMIIPRVLWMIKAGSFNHNIYDYGSLYFIFLYLLFVGVAFLTGISSGRITSIEGINESVFYITARSVNVLFAALSIVLVYLIGKRYSDKKTALAAAVVTGVGVVHFLNSITARIELMVLVFVLASFYYILKMVEGSKITDYLYAGVFAGLAIGTKFYSVSIISALLYAHLFYRGKKGWSHKKLLAALAAILLVYLVTNPFIITNTDRFLNNTSRLADELRIEHHWSSRGISPSAVYTRMLLIDGIGPVGGILMLAAVFLFLLKPNRKDGLLLIFPLLHFLFLINSKYTFHRYILVIIPFLVIFTLKRVQLSIEKYLKFSKKLKNYLFWIMFGFILIIPSYRIIKITAMYQLPVTSDKAYTWILKNIPVGSRVIVSAYSVAPEKILYSVNEYKQGAKWLTYSSISKPGEGYQFIITSSRENHLGLQPEVLRNCRTIAVFKPEKGKVSGPRITILRIISVPSKEIRRSKRLFLTSGEQRFTVKIGNSEEDTKYLSSEWGIAKNDHRGVFRWVKMYPASFFFKLSEDAAGKGNVKVSVELMPQEREPIENRGIELRFNGTTLCSYNLRYITKPEILTCPISPAKLNYGMSEINRLEIISTGGLYMISYRGKEVAAAPPVRFYSITIHKD